MEFSGNGTGIESDKYQIVTKAHLNELRDLLGTDADRFFILMNDIEFVPSDFEIGGDFYNDGNGWVPFRTTAASSWNGDLDLNGFSITGLYSQVSRFGGLFGNIGLAASARGTVYNGTIEGTFEGEREIAVVSGRVMGAIIENVSAKGVVNFVDVGLDSNSNIGGFAGWVRDAGTQILNCSADVEVNGGISATTAGFISNLSADTVVDKCLSKGVVSGSGADVFGGIRVVGGVVTNSFYDSQVSTIATQTDEGMSAKTTAEMQNIDTYTNIANSDLSEAWDIVLAANFDENTPPDWVIDIDSYPVLSHEFEPASNPSGIITLNGTAIEGAAVAYIQADNRDFLNATLLGVSVTNAQGQHDYSGEAFDDTKLLGIAVSAFVWDNDAWKKYGKFEWSTLNLDLSAPT